MNPWICFIFLLAGRSLDLWSTYLVSPSLRGESNALFRRLGWRVNLILNIGLCALLYSSVPLTAMVTVLSLLVCIGNCTVGMAQRKNAIAALTLLVASIALSGAIVTFIDSYAMVGIYLYAVIWGTLHLWPKQDRAKTQLARMERVTATISVPKKQRRK